MSEQKKITIKEFNMWLEGVEEMQEEGWTPDARQWARIREKLNNIADVAAGPTYTLPPRPPGVRDTDQPGPGYQPFQQIAAPSAPLAMPPRMSAPHPRGPLATGGGQAAVKTPDIDTQDKPYESSFV